ncbi:MAG: penicillin-binding protein 2 [Solirubrobacterales bacterium]|nr:penicillin-binding protein 2 [Solirubrobacterales bacterium]
MIQGPDDRRAPITPQLAVRVALMGGFALVMFAIIFFRLWFLQVLSGHDFLAKAQQNRVRSIVVQAPRGEILDRNGKQMVKNRATNVVQVDPAELPTNQVVRARMFRRLAFVIGRSRSLHRCVVGEPTHPREVLMVTSLQCEVEQAYFRLPYASVTVKTDASSAVVGYIAERASKFQGVTAPQINLRQYPYKDIAAQVLGYVGEISPTELTWHHFKGVSPATVVGQNGLEYQYDRYLRGKNGAQRISVDALGNANGPALATRNPIPGENLRLSVDQNVEAEGMKALKTGISLAHGNGNPADAGAFVAMDPSSGEIYAMGSYPSFDPDVFAKPISTAHYNQLFGKQANYPQLNRAIQSAYPTGSTFKPITATAALEAGKWAPGETYTDTGTFTDTGGGVRQNAGKASYGTINIVDALRVSSDVFFYNLGRNLNDPRPAGGALQTWARRYGIGRRTGVDLPGETTGTLPSPTWRANRNTIEHTCERKTHKSACGIADGRPWSEGDNENLAVGQGDVGVSPLQLATAYSALANGGRVVTPHIGLQIEDAVGKVVQRFDKPPSRHIALSPAVRAQVMQGLYGAANSPGGTSEQVWKGFPSQYKVFGKTGTAQLGLGRPDQSWYACYVQAGSRSIVVAVTIEKGGFGAEAAAPAARLIVSKWLGVKGKVQAGHSKTL